MVPLAVAGTTAWPLASVTAVPLASVADAPDAGAVKVTVSPTRGAPATPRSCTVSGHVKAVLTLADCGVPSKATRPGTQACRSATTRGKGALVMPVMTMSSTSQPSVAKLGSVWITQARRTICPA